MREKHSLWGAIVSVIGTVLGLFSAFGPLTHLLPEHLSGFPLRFTALATAAATLLAVIAAYAASSRRIQQRDVAESLKNDAVFVELTEVEETPPLSQPPTRELPERRRHYNMAMRHVRLRLRDAIAARAKQESLNKWYARSSTLLVFSQYVIGGVLASAFVQKSLSPTLVGFFGVLVLVASLIKQHFRPETLAKDASEKARLLTALIRDCEDAITELKVANETDQDVHKAALTLAKNVSKSLSDIENLRTTRALLPKSRTPKKAASASEEE